MFSRSVNYFCLKHTLFFQTKGSSFLHFRNILFQWQCHVLDSFQKTLIQRTSCFWRILLITCSIQTYFLKCWKILPQPTMLFLLLNGVWKTLWQWRNHLCYVFVWRKYFYNGNTIYLTSVSKNHFFNKPSCVCQTYQNVFKHQSWHL